jgi:hypothetical protein
MAWRRRWSYNIRFAFDGNSIPVRMMGYCCCYGHYGILRSSEFVLQQKRNRSSRDAKATDRRFTTELTSCLCVDEFSSELTNCLSVVTQSSGAFPANSLPRVVDEEDRCDDDDDDDESFSASHLSSHGNGKQ